MSFVCVSSSGDFKSFELANFFFDSSIVLILALGKFDGLMVWLETFGSFWVCLPEYGFVVWPPIFGSSLII